MYKKYSKFDSYHGHQMLKVKLQPPIITLF